MMWHPIRVPFKFRIELLMSDVSHVTFNEVKGYLWRAWSFIKRGLTIEVIGFFLIMGLCIYVFVKQPSTGEKRTVEGNERTSELQRMLKEFEDQKLLLREDVSCKPHKSHSSHKPHKKPKIYKMQERCRKIFEEIFDRPFPSVRPTFLMNPVTGENLELDGYCEPLKIAFEYDGIQHSKYTEFFHKRGPTEFVYQVSKDEFKTKTCKLEGITLVRIPHYIHEDSLKPYILRRLRDLKVLHSK